MKPHLHTISNSIITFTSSLSSTRNPSPFPRLSHPHHPFLSLTSTSLLPSRFVPIRSSKKPLSSDDRSSSFDAQLGGGVSSFGEPELERNLSVQVGDPVVPSFLRSFTKLSLSDQAFFLFTFIACTTSIAFTSLVIAAVPTLYAMGRAATSLAKLADTAREELPSTMAAIRLSGMEISDLTLELSDLSQEITEGVNKSAQAVQAAEAGIRQIGTVAHQHTISMIQERASLPIISLQPVVAGAAKKTSRAVGQATKSFLNMISGGDVSAKNEDNGLDRVEI